MLRQKIGATKGEKSEKNRKREREGGGEERKRARGTERSRGAPPRTPLIKRTPFGPRPIPRSPAFRDSTRRSKVDSTIPSSTLKDGVDD